MAKTLKELRERVADLRSDYDTKQTRLDAMTSDESTEKYDADEFDKRHQETQTALDAMRAATLELRAAEVEGDTTVAQVHERRDENGELMRVERMAANPATRTAEDVSGANERFLRFAFPNMPKHEVERLSARNSDPGLSVVISKDRMMLRMPITNQPYGDQERALVSIGAGTPDGSDFLADAPMAQLVEAQKFIGGVRASAATVFTTETGGELPIPTSNDTANTAVIVGQGVSNTDAPDPPTASVKLTAYTYRSKFIKASQEFLQDSSVDPVSWITRQLARRIYWGQNVDFTVGNGVDKPNGIVNAAHAAPALAGADDITDDDLIKTLKALEYSYTCLLYTSPSPRD